MPRYQACGPQTEVLGLTSDSRNVHPGFAFLALPGARHDGHAFLTSARAAGATVLIVQEGRLASVDGPAVWLPSTDHVAPILAANAHGRPGERLRLAAVTGTNGKTTTAHLVGAMLGRAHMPYVRLGTTGNWVVDHEAPAAFTTPFPLDLQALLAAATQRGATHGVMEVSSHALAQRRIAPLRFAAVGMTSFSQDHLDFHPSMEAYLEAKLELVRAYLTEDALAVAATDAGPAMERFLTEAQRSGARTWRASRRPGSDIQAEDVVFAADRTRARIHTPMGSFDLSSPMVADYNLDNLMVAIGLALGLGVPLDDLACALAEARGAPGRLERVEVNGVDGPTVIVDYAHTPDAVERALRAVRALTSRHVIVVLGCGGDRDPSKRAPMAAIAARGSDRFWLTSDNPRSEDPTSIAEHMAHGVAPEDRRKVTIELDRARAIALAIAQAGREDVVLIAGKGHEDYQIVGSTRLPFDDRAHARSALDTRQSG